MDDQRRPETGGQRVQAGERGLGVVEEGRAEHHCRTDRHFHFIPPRESMAGKQADDPPEEKLPGAERKEIVDGGSAGREKTLGQHEGHGSESGEHEEHRAAGIPP